MAHSNALSTSNTISPPQDPFATPLTVNDVDPESEQPDDWEYEYSSTEIESFYVTLDLTTDDIAPSKRAKRSAGSGGAKAKWLNPALGRVKRKKAMDRSESKAAKLQNGQTSSTQIQDPETEDEEADIDDDAPGMPDEPVRPQHEGPEDDTSKVQILGLHSKNPLVSYNGNVFSCHWASNIGTELLFSKRDTDSELPVLRALPGNVDLLGASSIRLVSAPILLKPKKASLENSGQAEEAYVAMIPMGTRSSDERKGQAHFLEKLVALKAARGESDEVTIFATRRMSRKQWRDFVAKKNFQERRALQKVVDSKKMSDEKKEEARTKLAELEMENEAAEQVHRQWLGESRPQGNGRTRVVAKDSGQPSRKKARFDNVDVEVPGRHVSTLNSRIRNDDEEIFDAGDMGENGQGDFDKDEYGDGDGDGPGSDEDAPDEFE